MREINGIAVYEPSEIRLSKDYDMFELMPWNRSVSEAHVSSIVKSIGMNGQVARPIVVFPLKSGKYGIADGQHGFTAFKGLGLPIPYIVIDDIGKKQVITMNINMSTWSKLDHIKGYAEQGISDYVRVAELFKEYPAVPCDVIITVARYTDRGPCYGSVPVSVIASGQYKVTNETIARAKDTLEFLSGLSPTFKKTSKIKENTFNYAAAFVHEQSNISDSVFSNLIVQNIDEFTSTSSTEGVIKQIQTIYNSSVNSENVELLCSIFENRKNRNSESDDKPDKTSADIPDKLPELTADNLPKMIKTTNYGTLKHAIGNKPINELRVNQLIEGIQRDGLVGHPIICNENCEMMDGQTLFEASKRLGLPVWFIKVPGLTVQHSRRMGVTQKNWRLADYIDSYANCGNENYVKLREMISRHSWADVTSVISLMYGNTGINYVNHKSSNKGNRLRMGEFVATDENCARTDSVLTWAKQFNEVFAENGGVSKRYGLGALLFIKEHAKDVDLKRLERVIPQKRTQLHEFANVEDALEQIEKIYNDRRGKATKVHFSDDFIVFTKSVKYTNLRKRGNNSEEPQ